MLDLITTLQAQHAGILVAVNSVRAALAARDPAAAQLALSHLGTLLKAHLALEDSLLYPALAGLPEQTSTEAGLMRAFEKHMIGISTALGAFLTRHSTGQADLNALEADWPLVCQMLQDRIESEEESLYPLYLSRSGHPLK